MAADAIALSPAVLDRLLPLHLRLDPAGRIAGLGPTLRSVLGASVIGQDFDTLFHLRRPMAPPDLMASLMAGARVDLSPRSNPPLRLRGLAQPLADGGVFLSLSFGLGITDAVRDHALTEADFAPTDLAVELLWLIEANTAVSAELRSLNHRLQGAQAAAQEEALTDILTGLRNRRALETALADHCAGAEGFALVHMDLDHFKAVNDTLGHAAGDHVLAEVARILTQETRAGDTVARLGGDEFVLLLSGMTDADRARQVVERIITRLSRPMRFEGQPCRIGASAGLVLAPPRAFPMAEPLQRQADAALYDAKRAGRGQVVLRDFTA